MEHLYGGYTLELCPGAFPLSTDSMALSGFVNLHKGDTVLDLGSGCGTLGMLLCASHPDCSVTGIELSAPAHEAALRNIERNRLSARLRSICADLRQIHSLVPPGSFSCCISNPPYFSGGPGSSTCPTARREDTCSLSQLFEAASWALRWGGDFYLVHRPERLGELCALADRNGMAPKKLCLLRHRTDGPVSLILLKCRKGARHGLVLEEQSLHNSDGSPTELYRRLYHL